MLKATSIIILVFIIYSGYSAILTSKNVDSGKSQTITVAPNNDDSVKTTMSRSGNDQGDMKTEETVKSEEVDMMPDIMAIMNECNESFRIEMSFLESLNVSGSFPDETVRTPKCYVNCLLEMTGIASEDGQYNTEQTAMIFAGVRGGKTVNDLQDIAADCAADRKESCKCERAYQFMKCLMETELVKYEYNKE